MMDPPEADLLVQQGSRLSAGGAPDQAEALLHQALELAPGHPMAVTRLAELDIARKQPDAAIRSLTALLRHSPHFAPAWAALAQASWMAGSPTQGLRHARRALGIAPHSPQFRLLTAEFCAWFGRRQEAEALLAPLLSSDQPDPMVRAFASSLMGEAAMAAGDYQAADQWFDAALDGHHPGGRRKDLAGLAATRLLWGMNRLRLGDFEAGLQAYEQRIHVPSFHPSGPPIRPAPAWTGQPLHGCTILLEDDQGFGDAIQFFRYASPLREAGAARIVLRTYPPLATLFRTAAPFVEVVDARPPALAPNFHCLTASLPHGFGTRLSTIPSNVPYLHAPALDGGPHPGLPASKRPRVGLAWSGDPRHPRDLRRSIPAARFLRLADRGDLDFTSLQREVRPADLSALAARPHVRRSGEAVRDFADTAALVAQLDLLVTVDTSVAHLAGALGKPVWLLLPVAPDWRWLADRTDSPWYPTIRLFRADGRGWGPVLRRVAAALNRLAMGARL